MFWFCFILLLGLLAVPAHAAEIIEVDPSYLRISAISVVEPVFPAGSVRRSHTGRVVASITVASDGRPELIEIYESPDEEIAASVKSALSLWRFRPFFAGDTKRAVRAHSRLVFYFSTKEGKPIVVDANEVRARMLDEQSRARQQKRK